MNIFYKLFAVIFLIGIIACQAPQKEVEKGNSERKTLPILGFKDLDENGDTIYHKIPDYEFIDQDSNIITPQTFLGKVYIADFFFTSCPTICPRMAAQMLRVYEVYKDNPQVEFLSHSIDPEYDQVPVLKKYADNLEIESSKWHLVTGDKEEIYEIAKSYFENASEDPNEPGGYLHSGAFYLIDQERRIRGYYNGVDPEKVDLLMDDIQLLMTE